MNNDTPAREIRDKDLAANVEAVRELLAHIPVTPIRRILDIRYGRGGWAKAARELFPKAVIEGYEQDGETADLAWQDRLVQLWPEPYQAGVRSHHADLLLADFSRRSRRRLPTGLSSPT